MIVTSGKLTGRSRELQCSILTTYRDTLTGAENRIGMITKLREQLELVKRRVQQCCIVLMDLDHFKDVNDRSGHLIGDQVLTGAVRHVKDHLRPYDKVFRYGGEEFLIVLSNTELQSGREIVERIRVGLSAIALSHAAGEPVFVTASFGLTLLDPEANIEETLAAPSFRSTCARELRAES